MSTKIEFNHEDTLKKDEKGWGVYRGRGKKRYTTAIQEFRAAAKSAE